MNTFKIFKPKKNNSIFNIDWIISLSFVISLLSVFLVDYFEKLLPDKISAITTGFLILLLITIIIIQLISNFLYIPLNGEFDGEITFNSDAIILGKNIYPISNIKKIHVFISDYKGMSL
ncbi:hypothetical protein [Mariniflexile sp.]|uniref:hypothetical protein n=1 Tax=Mariniflexile sp. TaxID=1979402 RepID=UPI0035669465